MNKEEKPSVLGGRMVWCENEANEDIPWSHS